MTMHYNRACHIMRNGIICVAPYARTWFSITELTFIGNLLFGPICIRVILYIPWILYYVMLNAGYGKN